jgi:hypothetical protein
METNTNRRYRLTDYMTRAALANMEEVGADGGDDLAAYRSGALSATALLDRCMDGADRDRWQGWRDYVDGVVAMASDMSDARRMKAAR